MANSEHDEQRERIERKSRECAERMQKELDAQELGIHHKVATISTNIGEAVQLVAAMVNAHNLGDEMIELLESVSGCCQAANDLTAEQFGAVTKEESDDPRKIGSVNMRNVCKVETPIKLHLSAAQAYLLHVMTVLIGAQMVSEFIGSGVISKRDTEDCGDFFVKAGKMSFTSLCE